MCVKLLVSNQSFQFFFVLVYAYLQSKLYIPSVSKILYVYNIILVYIIFSLKASGVNVLCGDKTMTSFIPKTLLRGLDLKNLRFLDTKCKGKEGRTHLSVTTSLTGCKTASRYTPTAIIYSNTLIIPVATKSAVTRLHDIKVQFSCYYSMHGTVSSLGWTPIKTTLELREVFVQVTVCNATNSGFKCSMKCPSSGRGKRELSDDVTYDVYSLVQGPLHLTQEKRKENRGRILGETGT